VNVWPAAVTAPLLAGPLFAATLNATVPGPEALVGDVTVIHGTVDAADHAHPADVFTSNEPCPPSSSTFVEVEDSANVQPCPWVSVNVCPATVSVALRAGPVVAAAAYWTCPFPLPVEPAAIDSHVALLDAAHVQPLPAVTLIVPVPPDDGTDALEGEIA
jgi:hypothetical protein